jgi:tetratricopeptide (TPR) repeat protein
MATNRDAEAKVQARCGELTLPAYRLLGENRNPVFHSQYGVAHIYPYTLQDEISSQPAETTYRTLELENRYLRLTVLPELGGRVYSVYDKISGRDVFYRNSIVRFAPLAIRGAFFSGGVEFSFPVAHAPTTASPVNWALRENADGSATASVGALEHLSGMRWTVSLTLFPDRCAVAQDVRLVNPTPIPGRYHYWTNASLHADEQTEFIYPLRRVRSYEFAGTAAWPIARLDLIAGQAGLPGMEGVPMWPAERMHSPISFRWEKDMLAQVSIFGRDVASNFFGAWQHSENAGYAHYADRREVAGMKLWSWGRSEVGVVNQTALTDDGSLYAETQCGVMETQLDFDFLPPGVTKAWREWWLPLRGLGGLTCASPEGGARLAIAKADNGYLDLLIAFCPVRRLEEAHLTVELQGMELVNENISCSPEAAWLHTAKIQPQALADHSIALRVSDHAGQPVLEYVHSREAHPIDLTPQAVSSPGETPDGAYRRGLEHENLDNRLGAMECYRQAVSLSDEHAPAHYRLGLLLLRAADFEGSRHHFEHAAGLGLVSARFYLGLISMYSGDPQSAGSHYASVPLADPLWSASQRGLGCMAMHEDEWNEASTFFREAGSEGPSSMHSSLLSAMALSRAGSTDAAREALQRILSADPLNFPALRETSLLQPEASSPETETLARLLADDPQYHLDLACFYLDSGLPGEALAVLQEASQSWQHPMCCYLAAFISATLGDVEAARSWTKMADQSGPERVFPSRLWEVIALLHHIQAGPAHSKAKYYLGTFYYAHERFEEASELWEDARKELGGFDVILRNLAQYELQKQGSPHLAIELCEKALALNPQNQDLYLDLDGLYHQQVLPKKRMELLAAMRKLSPIREDVRKRALSMMVELGMHEEALRTLAKEDFVPLEMDQSFHRVYVTALMRRAEAHLGADRLEDAARDYASALDFPENHGVGRPTTSSDAEILYRLGCVYERLGRFDLAIGAWQAAGSEHHPYGDDLYQFVELSLDKLGRFSELGFEV